MNPFCHIEIPVIDFDQAQDFYGKLFGWKIQHMPEMNYSIFEIEGSIGGGFYKVDEIRPSGIMCYILTDDIGKHLAQIESGGGKTTKPKTEIPNIGFYALFEDPFGNTLGLYSES